MTDSPEGNVYKRFNDWSNEQFREAAAKVEAKVGRKPSKKDYTAYAAEDPNFPAVPIINRLLGSVGALNELLGYPVVKLWADKDYIAFGAHVIRVNGAEKFGKNIIEVLSARKRGPSFSGVLVYFDTWGNYKSLVEQHISTMESRLARYRNAISDGALPGSFSVLTDEELMLRGARIDVINKLTPELSAKVKYRLASCADPMTFAAYFDRTARKRHIMHVTEADVEAEAEAMGLTDIIWPRPACYADYLYVTDDELAERRRANTRKYASWRNKQVA